MSLSDLAAGQNHLFDEAYDEEEEPIKRLKTIKSEVKQKERRPKPKPEPKKKQEEPKPKMGKAVKHYFTQTGLAVESSPLELPDLPEDDFEDPVTTDEEEEGEPAAKFSMDDLLFGGDVRGIDVPPKPATITPLEAPQQSQEPVRLPPPVAPPASRVPSVKRTFEETGAYNEYSVPTEQPKLSLVGSKQLKIYWVDAREDPSSTNSIYLFGKMHDELSRKWVTVCVHVTNIKRCVYILPRPQTAEGDEIRIQDVIEEMGTLLAGKDIEQRVYRVKDRWYSFEEPGVPHGRTKWVKLTFSSSRPLNLDCSKARTFSHVFGDKRTALETFIVKRKLKGPGWLTLVDPQFKPEERKCSWCTVETVVEPKRVIPMPDATDPAPPVTILSLNLQTFLNHRNVNEIACITCWIKPNVDIDGKSDAILPSRKTLLRKLDDTPFPFDLNKVFVQNRRTQPQLEQNEKSLLSNFLTLFDEVDPDVIVGHNFLGFDLDVLLHRMDAHKLSNWSKLGRLRLRHMPRLQSGAGGLSESTWEEKAILHGRLVADTYLLAKEYVKASSYKLLALALDQKLQGTTGAVTEDIVEADGFVDALAEYQSAAGLLSMCARCEDKGLLSFKLCEKLNAIPLTKRLTTLAGNLWSRTLTGARAERIEWLLLHKFHEQKFIVPDKLPGFKKKHTEDEDEKTNTKGKPKYAGGRVLEPKRGLYTDYVALLDFNSLYPSIIQEFNVCWTTVERPPQLPDGSYPDPPVPTADTLRCEACKEKNLEATPCPHRCILPKVVRELVLSRQAVKKMLKEEKDLDKRIQLDIRQKALKLTANSIYGCLGFQASRFYAQPLAQLITSKGREILCSTEELIPKVDPSLQVIYGDTDSVMVHMGAKRDLASTLALAGKIKKEVNKYYKHLEIELDGLFKSILLVRKKKYAALVLEDPSKPDVVKREVKGLDLVRRDWCPLSHTVSREVLDIILSGKPSEEIQGAIFDYLKQIAENVRSERVPLKEYVITKSITKDPEAYADRQNQPHVMVALKMKSRNIPVRPGDFIPYVVCDPATLDEQSSTATADLGKIARRAFHVDEVTAAPRLKPDLEWYLGTQIHPPISRLCEHIPELNSYAVATVLGIESSRYVSHQSSETKHEYIPDYRPVTYSTSTYDLDDDERFGNASPLTFACPVSSCGAQITISVKRRLFQEAERLFLQPDKDENFARAARFFSCDVCGGSLPFPKIYNTLALRIREFQKRYYQSQGLAQRRAEESYSANAAMQQFYYFMSLFDFTKGKEQAKYQLLQKYSKRNQKASESHNRRLIAIFDAIVAATLPQEVLNLPEDADLPREQLRPAYDLRMQLASAERLIRRAINASPRRYVDTAVLFKGMGEAARQ
eukprot:TRINITY_DN2542_c0_g1_i1.p1 TRINITY_DN2542_c0_g1~~TRINITY_DN2542_c0_g1_i1.p1  ORF type:complete len:1368 (+),score=229.60 TRINITY_DN2542_c0_g1_i1:33-4136(+)